MDIGRDTMMARNTHMSVLKRLYLTFMTGLLLVILVSGCSTKMQSGRLPELILEYGWSPEFSCVVNGREHKCRAMTSEDVERLRVWIIIVQEVCKYGEQD